jgi:hypothetical protein
MRKVMPRSNEDYLPGGRRLRRRQTVDGYRGQYNQLVNQLRADVFQEMALGDPNAPEYVFPKLEPGIDELNDHDLMELFVKLTRFADFFQAQLAVEEIAEKYAEAEVKKLEGLYMIGHKPVRVSEQVTWVRASMEGDPEVQTARDALRLFYARRKLKQVLFEQAERDAAVISRELTRRTDTSMINRRADYRSP